MPFEEKTPENPNDDCDDAMGLAESSDDSDAPRVKHFGDENHVDRMGQNVSRAGREGNATPPLLKKKRIFGKTSPQKIPIVAKSKESSQCTSSKMSTDICQRGTNTLKRTVQATANSGNSDEKRPKTSGGATANSGNNGGSGSSNNAETLFR